MKKCLICNKEIDRKSPKAKYCSDSCKYKAYRIRNPDKVKESQEKYNKNNYQKRLETWRKYRIKTGRSKTIWTEDLINTCIECGKKFHPPKTVPFKKFCSLNCGSRHRQRKWKESNPQRVKEIMRKYDKSKKGKERRKRRYDKIKAYQKEWLRKHPEKTAEYSKNYRKKDSKRVKRIRKKYEKSIKGIFANRKRSHIYRMLEKKNYNHNKLIPILEEQDNKCPLCGAEYGSKLENMELGHIFPLKKFPTIAADVENIIPICKTCNRKMRDNIFSDFCIKKNYPIPKRVINYIKKQKSLLDF